MTYYIPYEAATVESIDLIVFKLIRIGLDVSVSEMGAGYILEVHGRS